MQLRDTEPLRITEAIKELLPSKSVGPITALVPIGLSRPYLGLIPRLVGHQTFLEIHKDKDGNITATHHDSKGWLAWIMYKLRIYSLKTIENAVSNAFTGNTVTFNHLESGNQSISNNVDCVRYTAAAIEQIINNKDRRTGDRIGNINETDIQAVQQTFIKNDITELKAANRILELELSQDSLKIDNGFDILEENSIITQNTAVQKDTKEHSDDEHDDHDFFTQRRDHPSTNVRTKIISESNDYHQNKRIYNNVRINETKYNSTRDI